MTWAMAVASGEVPAPPATILDQLRSATREVHQRLHGHGGLAAVSAGTIDRAAYMALLGRLYGFHHPFEVAAQDGHERTRWLEDDLTALGVDAERRRGLPRCAAFAAAMSGDHLMGARYVIEGSALGGRGLARGLDHLLGPGVMAGRRFFSGHGADTGGMWRAYLARLSAASANRAGHAAIIAGATSTFAIFEQWLAGWNDRHE
jgi:heme oxygenase